MAWHPIPKGKKRKGADDCRLLSDGAEREGFEPPEPFSSTVFKTAAIDHSAIFPKPFGSHFSEKRCKGSANRAKCKINFNFFCTSEVQPT